MAQSLRLTASFTPIPSTHHQAARMRGQTARGGTGRLHPPPRTAAAGQTSCLHGSCRASQCPRPHPPSPQPPTPPPTPPPHTTGACIRTKPWPCSPSRSAQCRTQASRAWKVDASGGMAAARMRERASSMPWTGAATRMDWGLCAAYGLGAAPPGPLNILARTLPSPPPPPPQKPTRPTLHHTTHTHAPAAHLQVSLPRQDVQQGVVVHARGGHPLSLQLSQQGLGSAGVTLRCGRIGGGGCGE
jgi:hypothetical protein